MVCGVGACVSVGVACVHIRGTGSNVVRPIMYRALLFVVVPLWGVVHDVHWRSSYLRHVGGASIASRDTR